MRLVLVGPPGAGKGTQAAILQRRLSVPKLSTGDMFRAAISEQTGVGRSVESFLASGSLVPDDMVNAVVRERLSAPDCGNGFLLDGFPRNLDQAMALDSELGASDLELDAVVVLEIMDALLCERIDKRARESGQDLRPDDNPEILAERMRVYHKQTKPVISFYSDRGLVRRIDAGGTVDRVMLDIKEALMGPSTSAHVD